MSTFTKRTVNPETSTKLTPSFFACVSVETKLDETFFVVGRAITGARFYSETVKTFEDAIFLFEGYCDIVSYFGGGEVELFTLTNDEYDIVKQEII